MRNFSGAFTLVLVLTLVGLVPPGAAEAQEAGFDHTATRFLLTGSHEQVRCKGCHQQGLFRGTPTECSFCHSASGTRAESVRPFNHAPTSNRCQDCHVTTSWENARFDHASVSARCSGCHNGVQAEGKPTDHVVTTSECDVCHIDIAWEVIRFDHSSVSGQCSSCHNGVEATGKPNDHIQTSSECDLCHSTRAWSPATFDHDNISGPCQTCHDGVDATGTPNDHFITSRDCDECHTTRAWEPDTFRHISASYPGDHRRDLACSECHRANSDAVQWPFASLQPDCGGCHQADFKPGPHKKYENPETKYNVSELRDCTGSCHVFKDSSMSEIKETRNGEHRVDDGEF
jgi:hypothetical protein